MRPIITTIRRRLAAASLTTLALAGLGACGDGDTTNATTDIAELQPRLAAHDWLLNPADSSLTTTSTHAATLRFGPDVDMVSGAAPCNTFRGHLAVDGNRLRISEVATTMRACEPDVMAAEEEFLAALQAVGEVGLSGEDSRLVLTGDADDRLVFDAIDPTELVIGTWHVVNVARDEAIQSVLVGTEPTLTFDARGDVVLDTGCNTLRADFDLTGSELTVGTVATTMMMCVEPEGVMEQETALAAALEAATQVEITPDMLTLLDGDDLIVLVAIPPG